LYYKNKLQDFSPISIEKNSFVVKIQYMRSIFIFVIALSLTSVFGQEVIDGNFAFQNDPAKKYSIYVPSSYDDAIPHALMIGFHPLNTNRWDAEAWRDTLIDFAEFNQLLLACPDGGIDGRVDDPIDTAFTTVLIDSLGTWFNVDRSQQYAIGFSWGARTVYSYTMHHPNTFKGAIPVGAAIDGTSQFLFNVADDWSIDYYVVHGSNDSPSVRYFPALDYLEGEDICHDKRLLSGVGHTIDFPNRNTILSEAFDFVSSPQNCIASAAYSPNFIDNSSITISPNPITDNRLKIEDTQHRLIAFIQLFDTRGSLIHEFYGNHTSIEAKQDLVGVYILSIHFENGAQETKKILFAK